MEKLEFMTGRYNKFSLYSKGEKGIELGEKILDKNYEVITEYKNTERNYVAKIKIDDEYYVLKSPKSETVIPQRKIQTFLKKGEALNSFINILYAKKLGFDCFVEPIVVMVKRGIFIKESFILMKYYENKGIETKEDIDKIVEQIKELHKKGIYHGDLNTSNFIKTDRGIKIIDTQAKIERFWWFKRNYDILTLKNDLLVITLNYDIDKKYKLKRYLSYFLASFIKNLKKVSLIQKIRKVKVDLRNRGWRI